MFQQFSRAKTPASTALAASTDSTAFGTRYFLEQIAQAVRSERLGPPDPREVAEALKVQSRSSVRKALQLLKTLDKALFQVNTFHSNAILSGCRNWEESLGLLNEFKCNSCADAGSYNCVMNSLEWPIALALVGNLKTLNSNTHSSAKESQDLTISHNCLISSCKTQDAWKHSLHFLNFLTMEELRPDKFSYMAALDVLQKSQPCLWRRSCHILGSMPAGASGVQPDIFSWNSMLASVPVSNWKTDLYLLNSMRSMRFFAPVPDLITYHTGLRGEDWRIVLSGLTSTAKQQLKVNVVTLNSVLGSFTTTAWARATVMLDDMASNSILPDVLSFNSFLHTCGSGSSGLSHGIWLDALREYERHGLRTDSFSVSSAIKVRSQAARSASHVFDTFFSGWQEGLNALQAAKNAGHRKLAICANVVLKEFSEVSEWQAALVLLGIESDEFSLSAVISACEKAFKWPQALFLLHTMPAEDAKDIVCFGAAASACEKGKQWQLALSLLSEMSDCILQPNLFTFNAVISACGHAREWARALSLLEVLGSEADVVSYNAVTRLSRFESEGIFVICCDDLTCLTILKHVDHC